MEIKVENYIKMISKKAHFYSRKTGVEFVDLQSEGFVLFCQAVKRFDQRKGVKFSTFLTAYLNGLSRAAEQDYWGDLPDNVVSGDNFCDEIEMHEAAKKLLSNEAYKILWTIIRNPSLNNCHRMAQHQRQYGWCKQKTKKIWDELGKWWREEILLISLGKNHKKLV